MEQPDDNKRCASDTDNASPDTNNLVQPCMPPREMSQDETSQPTPKKIREQEALSSPETLQEAQTPPTTCCNDPKKESDDENEPPQKVARLTQDSNDEKPRKPSQEIIEKQLNDLKSSIYT